MSRRRARCLAVLAIPCVLFAAVESALRLAGFSYDPGEGLRLIGGLAALAEGSNSLLVTSPTALWENRPGGRGDAGGVEAHANEDGFRVPRIPRERTPGIARVACLGDSSTFGWAVQPEEAYPALLGRELARSGVPAEVLNAGVVGYTAFQGLAHFRERVAPFRPDLVVLHFGAKNDHAPAYKLDDVQWTALLSFRARWDRVLRPIRALRVVQGIERLRVGRAYDPRSLDEILRAGEPHRDESGRWKYGRRLEPDKFRRAVEKTVRAARRAGGKCLILVPTIRPGRVEQVPSLVGEGRLAYRDALYAAAAETRAALLDIARVFSEEEVEAFSLDAVHPGPEAHRRIARAASEIILSTPGLLPASGPSRAEGR